MVISSISIIMGDNNFPIWVTIIRIQYDYIINDNNLVITGSYEHNHSY